MCSLSARQQDFTKGLPKRVFVAIGRNGIILLRIPDDFSHGVMVRWPHAHAFCSHVHLRNECVCMGAHACAVRPKGVTCKLVISFGLLLPCCWAGNAGPVPIE
jgi:hypothetical protein